jgi:hypothetical protein
MKGVIVLLLISFLGFFTSCKDHQLSTSSQTTISSNTNESGTSMEIRFLKGRSHNHPTFAFWIEDMEGNFVETLFVTQYLGTGVFGHASLGEGKWDNKQGEAKRPAALPYWIHKRGTDGESLLPTIDHPVVDAITGATPNNDFVLASRSKIILPQKFRVMMEINQSWDWNEYWNNGKYLDDFDYQTSCQPALVYAVTVDRSKVGKDFYLNPIGHSHYAGKDGELYTDLSTITTAAEIVHQVLVRLQNE